MNSYDGWITIGTKLNTNQFDKQMRDLERKMDQVDKERSEIKIDIDVKTGALNELNKEMTGLGKKANDIKDKIGTLNKKMDVGKFSSVADYQFTLYQIEKSKRDYDELIEKSREIEREQALITKEIEKQNKTHSKLVSKVGEYKQKYDEINLKKHQAEIKETQKHIGEITNGIRKTIKQVVSWGLAIFGIRSAYLAVRSAMSTLSQYDETMAANIEYIRWALAVSLKPVVEYIINLAATLLNYINTILNRLFNINLFSKATAEDFKNAKNSLNGANKEANKLKKTLLGFDEMNILQDDGSTALNGGLPSINLGEEQEIPEWMKFLLNFGDVIISIIVGVATALKMIELNLGLIKSIGIGVAVAGLTYAIINLIKYLKDPTWENFGKVLIGIGVLIVGLGIAFLGIPAVVTGVLVTIVGLIATHWEQIKNFFQNGINWIKTNLDNFGNQWTFWLKMITNSIVNQLQITLNYFNNFFYQIKNIFDSIINFVRGVFTGNWNLAWNGLVGIVKSVMTIIISTVQLGINTLKNLFTIMFATIGGIASEIVKGALNLVLSTIEGRINNAIGMFNGVLSIVNALPGVSISRIATVKLPRLAKGGVINQPGRGVMVGSAIAGEKGQEGVIPLTDSQQMQLLGEAIGKYITINATITNSMNGRVLSRELQRIQNDSDFAFNR